MPQLRLTNGIRSGGDFAPPPGVRSPRSLRSHGSLHPQFTVAGLASQALFRNRKSSYTLNVMRHKKRITSLKKTFYDIRN
jgi:hypothetical protein